MFDWWWYSWVKRKVRTPWCPVCQRKRAAPLSLGSSRRFATKVWEWGRAGGCPDVHVSSILNTQVYHSVMWRWDRSTWTPVVRFAVWRAIGSAETYKPDRNTERNVVKHKKKPPKTWKGIWGPIALLSKQNTKWIPPWWGGGWWLGQIEQKVISNLTIFWLTGQNWKSSIHDPPNLHYKPQTRAILWQWVQPKPKIKVGPGSITFADFC